MAWLLLPAQAVASAQVYGEDDNMASLRFSRRPSLMRVLCVYTYSTYYYTHHHTALYHTFRFLSRVTASVDTAGVPERTNATCVGMQKRVRQTRRFA